MYLVIYTVKHLDGQTRRFSEFWDTQRQPTHATVAGYWHYVSNDLNVDIKDFVVREATDEEKTTRHPIVRY